MVGSDSEMTLVATKLAAPTPPPNLVERPRLDEVIDTAIADPNVRVLLVSAPAGSGKSTLIASRLASSEAAWGWLQADVADHDPARFWTHVVASLARSVPDIESAVAPAVPGSAVDARPLIEGLVNHLTTSGDPVALVVDDYHVISNPAIDQGLEQLIELAPGCFTLVLCTRIDPPLRLSRLRVRGHLVEIRAGDLRFEVQEASTLLRQRGATPLERHVDALCERTEGWAAGLVLASMSLADSPDADAFVAAFQGDDRLVADYLTDEFLSGVSPEDRHRLVRTSILDRLTGPLVDALGDTTDGAAWLRELAARNQLLISLDRTGTWFRYHHLLGDLLRLEAGNLSDHELEELHRRAGSWLRRHGLPHDAVEHYTRSGDHHEAADLIYDEATELLNGGQLATLKHQIARLGPVADHHIGTAIVNGFIALFTGDITSAQRYLALARDLGLGDDERRPATALAIYIAIAVGDVASALAEADGPVEPTESSQALSLATARTWAGDFTGAEPLLQAAERLSVEQHNALVTAGVPVYAAIAAIETGRDPEAADAAGRALEIAEATGAGSVAQLAVAHSIIGRASDDPDDALAASARAVDLVSSSGPPLTRSYALTSAADVLTRHDQPDADGLLRRARSIIDGCPDPGIVGQYLARIEARTGTLEPAPPSPGLVENLTDREQAVLRYLPSQLSQRDIANELYVSLNTVRTHCKAIYRKLGVGDRKAAVQAARDHGLL